MVKFGPELGTALKKGRPLKSRCREEKWQYRVIKRYITWLSIVGAIAIIILRLENMAFLAQKCIVF